MLEFLACAAIYRDYDLCVRGPVQLVHPFALGSADISVTLWVKYSTGPGVTPQGVFLEVTTAL